MEDDSKELKRKLEDVTGHRFDLSPDSLTFSLWYSIGAYDYGGGSSVWRSFLQQIRPPTLKRCQDNTLLDASGVVVTDNDGKRTFLLSEFVCLPKARILAMPVNVLATPQSEKPVFATTAFRLVDPGDFTRSDVEITLLSWESSGDPAPQIVLHWRCRVVSQNIIL